LSHADLITAGAEAGKKLSIHKDIVRLARLLPVMAVIGTAIVVLLGGSGGCGKGLFPTVNVNSSTATSTSTASATAFLYASNFNDGTVSAFQKKASGALSFISKTSAGAVGGPLGMTVALNNDVLYVVNQADNEVHIFDILSAGPAGGLQSSGFAATGTAPQMIAVDESSAFAYVTNATSRSLSEYSVAFNGILTNVGTDTGFLGKPFGIIANPTMEVIYVTDETAAFVYAFSINTTTGNLTQISQLSSNGGAGGTPTPTLMAISTDTSGQQYLDVNDSSSGIVYVFMISSVDGSLTFAAPSTGTVAPGPVGIAAVDNFNGTGVNYVFNANPLANLAQSFTRSLTALTAGVTTTDNFGPTGLLVDSTNSFVYTANSGNGTIAELQINGTCGQPLCLINTFASQNPPNTSAGTQFLAITK
jgi:6-phosphogluconolactonase (cycloisomerase 2 family)